MGRNWKTYPDLVHQDKEQGNNALESIEKLLVRYFVGLLLEVLGVMTLLEL